MHIQGRPLLRVSGKNRTHVPIYYCFFIAFPSQASTRTEIWKRRPPELWHLHGEHKGFGKRKVRLLADHLRPRFFLERKVQLLADIYVHACSWRTRSVLRTHHASSLINYIEQLQSKCRLIHKTTKLVPPILSLNLCTSCLFFMFIYCKYNMNFCKVITRTLM